MTISWLLISLFITLNTSKYLKCYGALLTAVIRDNLNGNFALNEELDDI